MPTLILHGDDDQIVPICAAAMLSSKMVKNAQFKGIEFECQAAQEFIAGETLHGLAARHGVSRNLIRVWVMPMARHRWRLRGMLI